MKFLIAAISFQILLLILFATLARYDPEETGPQNKTNRGEQVQLYSCKCMTFCTYVYVLYLCLCVCCGRGHW